MECNQYPVKEYGDAGSFHTGELPEGCRRCLEGKKLVLYTTGRCKVGCFYCTIPYTDKKLDTGAVNERKIKPGVNDLEIISDETEKCLATGAGITGGDPLAAPERTIQYIRYLRDKYGEDYHIHLYTSGAYLSNTLLERLYNAGLNELRFHPKNISALEIMKKARDAKNKFPDMIIGFEIPAIPGMEDAIIDLIRFADHNDIDFVNFNEFEFTEANFPELDTKGFVSILSGSAVKGSADMMKDILHTIHDEIDVPLHFCSSASKDKIQLTQRYIRRANQIARPFDAISKEGELEFGRLIINANLMTDVIKTLTGYFEVPDNLFSIVDDHIETSWIIVEEIIDELRGIYPTIHAEIIARHPIKNGPITFVNPL